MYCKYCGTQIPDGSVFCVSCGKNLSSPVAAEEPRQDPVEAAAPRVEPENTPSGEPFDWSTLNPVPEEPVKPEEPPVQQPAQEPRQEEPRQGAQQNPWQGSQQSAPGWPQNNQQPNWQSGPQQGYQAGWQTPPQQSAYRSPYEERKQPVYQNGRIHYGCPMNWYKFQIYFNMIPAAISYMALGAALIILALGMERYSVNVEYFYREFANMLRQPEGLILMYLPVFIPHPLMIGMGSLAYGILLMVAWVKMIRLRKGGWVIYLVLSVLPGVFVAINLLIMYSKVGPYIPDSYMMEIILPPLIAIAISVVMLVLQIVYFKKRAYLFVN